MKLPTSILGARRHPGSTDPDWRETSPCTLRCKRKSHRRLFRCGAAQSADLRACHRPGRGRCTPWTVVAHSLRDSRLPVVHPRCWPLEQISMARVHHSGFRLESQPEWRPLCPCEAIRYPEPKRAEGRGCLQCGNRDDARSGKTCPALGRTWPTLIIELYACSLCFSA